MVVRKEKRSRKYLGTRRWGVGNIKNARGKGDRGGVGRAGARKHKFTHMTAKEPWLIRRKGFTKWNAKRPREVTLSSVNSMKPGNDGYIDLRGCKVLSNGALDHAVKVSAAKFSSRAIEKIKQSGGEAKLSKASETAE